MQKEIVAEIEGHQREITRLKSVIEDEATAIQASLARVWGEENPGHAEE